MLTGQVPALPLWKFRSKREFDEGSKQLRNLHEHVRRHQERLKPGERLRGYSVTAEKLVDFEIDWPADGSQPNWRETVRCPETRLINRLRGSYHAFRTLLPDAADARIYLTEAATPFYDFIKARHPGAVGSEYLADVPFGQVGARGIRSEDFTALTFDDAAFDLVMTFEVLEHVPDYRAALREAARVLRPGGVMLLTAPFLNFDETLVREHRGGRRDRPSRAPRLSRRSDQLGWDPVLLLVRLVVDERAARGGVRRRLCRLLCVARVRLPASGPERDRRHPLISPRACPPGSA
jgi:hypothetical protein